MTVNAQTINYDLYPVYNGKDLGLTYRRGSSFFRIWSPPAEQAELVLYDKPLGGESVQRLEMRKAEQGTWIVTAGGDLRGKFYAFRVMINGKWQNEVPDPYAKAVGVNGRRAMVVDLAESNPVGWESDKPAITNNPITNNPVDAVVYELHVRDASISPNSGIRLKGKFLGLTETGTSNSAGLSTGLDHLKELGVTHVHLLPSYDFFTVDETQPEKPQYNWGYDPLNYNVPEGSYSTNAGDGVSRIKEFKQLIKTFHDNGIKVVMDVVYNHTMLTEDSWFNQLVPGYYYRQDEKGNFSNATACNNETASERPMFRKFMLESVKYWVEEYHVDGFRFDLMGVHDIVTMNIISDELHKLKPDILLYGEGWTAGASPLPEGMRALKKNAAQLRNIAVFSDDIRDGIKGSVFEHADKGFASGKPGMEESIKFGVVAATKHPQVDYAKVNYSKAPYASHPGNVVSYCECHDNHVLFDKLAISAATNTEAERREMHKLSLGIVLTSQGISFLHAGTEFLRSKNGVENSYESPDSINRIDWDLKTKNKDVYDYIRALIAMRRAHPAFRMTDAGQVAQNVKFLDGANNVISYTINGEALGDSWKQILVVYNSNPTAMPFTLPKGKWKAFVVDNALAPRKARPSTKVEAWGMSVYWQ
ncbi:MAG: type I pullulanase [Chitinophagaceae bacterium]